MMLGRKPRNLNIQLPTSMGISNSVLFFNLFPYQMKWKCSFTKDKRLEGKDFLCSTAGSWYSLH